MKQFLLKFFTWWNGQTFGTQFTTWRYGERVGEDHLGNVYYRTKGGRIDPALGIERRWVIYNGEAEASRIPEGWNGWLHHTVDFRPPGKLYASRVAKAPSAQSHRNAHGLSSEGFDALGGRRQPATGDYDAWTPG